MDSIRWQIIESIQARLETVLLANGYNTNAGHAVTLDQPQATAGQLPAICIHPGEEEHDTEKNRLVMRLRVEGIISFNLQKNSEQAELILADLKEALLAREAILAFTVGAADPAPAVSDAITGATSGAVATIVAVAVASGDFAAGTAAGTFRLRRISGRFAAGEILKRGGTPVATAGAITHQAAIDLAAGGLADLMRYDGGGPLAPADPGETNTGAYIEIGVGYREEIGNPYRIR